MGFDSFSLAEISHFVVKLHAVLHRSRHDNKAKGQ